MTTRSTMAWASSSTTTERRGGGGMGGGGDGSEGMVGGSDGCCGGVGGGGWSSGCLQLSVSRRRLPSRVDSCCRSGRGVASVSAPPHPGALSRAALRACGPPCRRGRGHGSRSASPYCVHASIRLVETPHIPVFRARGVVSSVLMCRVCVSEARGVCLSAGVHVYDRRGRAALATTKAVRYTLSERQARVR